MLPTLPQPDGMRHALTTLHRRGAAGRALPRARGRAMPPARSAGALTSASAGGRSSHGSPSGATGLGEDIAQPPPGSAWHPGPQQAAVATALVRGGRGQEGLATASPAGSHTTVPRSRRLARAGHGVKPHPLCQGPAWRSRGCLSRSLSCGSSSLPSRALVSSVGRGRAVKVGQGRSEASQCPSSQDSESGALLPACPAATGRTEAAPRVGTRVSGPPSLPGSHRCWSSLG